MASLFRKQANLIVLALSPQELREIQRKSTVLGAYISCYKNTGTTHISLHEEPDFCALGLSPALVPAICALPLKSPLELEIRRLLQ